MVNRARERRESIVPCTNSLCDAVQKNVAPYHESKNSESQRDGLAPLAEAVIACLLGERCTLSTPVVKHSKRFATSASPRPCASAKAVPEGFHMTADQASRRPLFGGMASMTMPTRMQDVSDFRPVPDHQEVYSDGAVDQSVIVEILV